MEYQDWLELPKQTKDKNKKFITKLKNKKPKNLDDMFHEKHEEVFEDIDCLKCGNCCKTTSPIFREVDIISNRINTVHKSKRVACSNFLL